VRSPLALRKSQLERRAHKSNLRKSRSDAQFPVAVVPKGTIREQAQPSRDRRRPRDRRLKAVELPRTADAR